MLTKVKRVLVGVGSFARRHAVRLAVSAAVAGGLALPQSAFATDPITDYAIPVELNPLEIGQDILNKLGGVVPATMVLIVGLALIFWVARKIMPGGTRGIK